MSSEDLKVPPYLAVAANSLRQPVLLLSADKTEIFAVERTVIIALCLCCLEERWQLLQKTQAWAGGVGMGEGEPVKVKSGRSSRGPRADMRCKEQPGKGGQKHNPWAGLG